MSALERTTVRSGSTDPGSLLPPSALHPDAVLLTLCARLGEMQDEWQRLWAATPEVGTETAADHALKRYSETVWPLAYGGPYNPAQLIGLHAVTLEGLRAKAAAIAAIDEASGFFTDCRDDAFELQMSLVLDAAGPAYRPVGAEEVRA